MKRRKTIEVEKVRAMVNTFLRDSSGTPDLRFGAASVLESVLHDTGNYKGYNYIAWLDGGCEQWQRDGKPKDNRKYLGDESRRYYY